MKAKDILIRYSISTLGLLLVAFGVALSLKSHFGVAPPSCPPTALSDEWPGFHIFNLESFGSFTWMFNCTFILLQLVLRPRRFDWFLGLMQVLAVYCFGFLCDMFNWMIDINEYATAFHGHILYALGAILATALGIKLEVLGKGWILPIDQLNAVITDMGKFRYSNVKIACDIIVVTLTAGFYWTVFGSPVANHTVFWGTIMLAFGVGLCMKLTDPLMDRLFGRFVK